MEVFMIYLWMSLPTFFITCAVFLALLVVPILAMAISRENTENEDNNTRLRNLQIRFLKFAIFPSCFLVFVPGQQTVAAMVVTHYAVEAASSTEGKKIMSLLRMTMNNYLDKELAAAAPKK